MGIELSMEVKDIIQRMLETVKRYHLEMMNTLVLFDTLLLNRLFATAIEVSSESTLEEIVSEVRKLIKNKDLPEQEGNNNRGFQEAIASAEKGEFFLTCIAQTCSATDVGTRFSQDLAFVFSFATDMAMVENRKEVTYEDVAKSFIENLSENMLEVFSDLEINVPEFKEHYEGAIAEKLEEFKIPASLTGCITVLNDKFKDEAQCDILGRDKECEEIWRNMMKKTKRNVILVGKPGVGKSSIVYKLTSDIVNQRCPEMFYDFIVLSLDVNNIIAGTSLRGQAEERFQDLIGLLKKHDNVILFIDEIHMIVGAGTVSHGEKQDLSNALKPILAGDDAIVIGATTDEEYAQTFGMEGALRRRFKTINVREPKTTEVYDMLKESIRQLEEFHEVRISKKMVEMIIFYSSCFNHNTSNPDRTKDLIDVSMVTARMSGKDHVDRASIMKNFGANFEEFHNMSEEMVRSTAYHEIGHFIVLRFSDKLINREVTAISIIPSDGYLGVTVSDATEKTVNCDKSYFTDLIAESLAGRIAEKIFMKIENNAGAENDLEKATKIAFKMVTKYGMTSRLGENQIYLNDKDYQMQTPAVTEIVNREVQKILDESAKRATFLLNKYKELVEELVNEITKKGMLSGKELNSIIELYEQKQAVTV
jgi:ATP-dependent clp protease ATP-binding subunit clpA